MQKSIYISYNPNSQREEELAFDLYKKGRENGFIVNLPQRNGLGYPLNEKTKINIDSSHWFLVFSTENFSEAVMSEIQYALRRGKISDQIIVVYSTNQGRNINFDEENRPIEICIDQYNFNRIEEFKEDVFSMISERNQGETKKDNNALTTILGIGAAILLFREILRSSD